MTGGPEDMPDGAYPSSVVGCLWPAQVYLRRISSHRRKLDPENRPIFFSAYPSLLRNQLLDRR